MIIWFFGLPGAGKSTLARRLSFLSNVPFVDLDDILTEREKSALLNHAFTVEMRLDKLARAVSLIQDMLSKYPRIITADSLPDCGSRKYIARSFGDHLRFVLVEAPRALHKKQIKARKNHFFTVDLLDKYEKMHWSADINLPHAVFKNTNGPGVARDKKLLELYNSIIHS